MSDSDNDGVIYTQPDQSETRCISFGQSGARVGNSKINDQPENNQTSTASSIEINHSQSRSSKLECSSDSHLESSAGNSNKNISEFDLEVQHELDQSEHSSFEKEICLGQSEGSAENWHDELLHHNLNVDEMDQSEDPKMQDGELEDLAENSNGRSAKDILNELAPKASKKSYLKAWEDFQKFKKSNGRPTENDYVEYFDFLKKEKKMGQHHHLECIFKIELYSSKRLQ